MHIGTNRIFSHGRPKHLVRLAAAALAAAVLSSACALLVAQTGAGAVAQADTQASWSAPTALPTYVKSLTGATVASGPTGTTLLGANIPLSSSDSIAGLWSLTNSGLTDRLSTYVNSTTQTVQFLPNGDAIAEVWDATDDTTTLSYRAAGGSLGGQVTVSGVVDAYAANDDELLVIQASGAGASATSYAITSGGDSITQSGNTVKIFSDPVNQIWAALDPGGTADVVVNAYTPNYSADYLAEIARTSSGTWQAPAQVNLPIDANLGFMRAAVAPGGRMLVTMEKLASGGVDPNGLYGLVREPGGSLGSAQSLLNIGNPPTGGFTAVENWLVAAGPDGTLAVTGAGESCAAQNYSTAKVSSTTVWIAAPGGSLSSQSVPGSTLTASMETSVTALAAGDGKAIIGLGTGVVTDSTSTGGGAPWSDDACGGQAGQATTVQDSDSAVILGPATDDTSGTLGSASVPAGSAGPTPLPNVSAAAIDPNGNATVLGYLDGSGTPDYVTFGDVGASATPVTTTPTTSTTTTTATTTPTTTTAAGAGSGSGQSTGGAQTVTTASAPLTETPAAVTRIADPNVVVRADQTVDFTNGGTVPETVAIFEWMVYAGLQGQQRGHAPLSKARLVKIATKKITVKPHGKVTVELHLSSAAQKLLIRNHRLAVELQLVTSAAGHTTTTVTRHLTLRHS